MREMQIIAGVPIDNLTLEKALERIEAFIVSGRPHQVATVNADFVVKAWHDAELRYILQVADMLTPDGMPLVWAARWLGVSLEGRVTGADMVPALAERGAQKGWRFYLLGARPGVAARAAEVLAERYPGFSVAGIYSPPTGSVVEMDPEIVERVRQTHPDVLLVAFGNPKQEKWIHMHRAELGVPVSIGVGGTFDFIAGDIRRAPAWMQNSGLEWLYRLLQEPKRLWRRYVVDMTQFTRFFVQQWWMQQRGKTLLDRPPEDRESIPDEPEGLSVGDTLTAANRAAFVARADEALGRSATLVLDLSQTSFVDSAGMGTLVDLTRRARANGGDVRLVNVRPQVRRTIELLRLDQFLHIDAPAEEGEAALGKPEAPPVLQRVGRWTVLAAPRRLDVQTAREVRSQGEQALEAAPYLVVDLSKTAYLDSSGIAALLALHRQAEKQGGELRLAGLTREVSRTLELAGMGRVLSQYNNLDSALGG